MPLTQVYANQLDELSIHIEAGFDALHKQGVTVFAGDAAAAASQTPRMDALLSKPCGTLTPGEITEIEGSNKNHHASRQRLFLLRQAWNDIIRLNKAIQARDITNEKKLASEIEKTQHMFDKTTVLLAKDSFKSNELTPAQIEFVKNLIELAHRLLRKQLAIKTVQALNTREPTPTHTEDADFKKAREAYNNAFVKHNTDYLPSIIAYMNALNELEQAIKTIESACDVVATESKALAMPSLEACTLETDLRAHKNKLHELLDKISDDNTTFSTLLTQETELRNAALELHKAKELYKKEVVTPTDVRAKELPAIIEARRETLATQLKAIKVNEKERFNEETTESSLAVLKELHQKLETSTNTEILALTTHQAGLIAQKTQTDDNDTKAKEAYSTCTMLLAETANDTAILDKTKLVCETQKDSKSFQGFYNACVAQFKIIHDKHETNTRLLPINPSGPVIIDTAVTTQLANQIKTTDGRIKAIEEQKKTILREHNAQQERNGSHFNHDMKTLQESVKTSTEKYEQALTAFEKQTQALLEAQREKTEEARKAIQAYNKKQIELTSDIQRLQEDKNEARHLKKRLNILKQLIEKQQLSTTPELNPDKLLLKLQNIPINRAQQTPKPKTGKTRLGALKTAIDALENNITHKTQSYHYRRKGTFIGGFAGGGLSILLLAGLVASIYFSFGIALPFLIGIGIAIAVSPGIFGGIGRLIGRHKDKITLEKQRLTNEKNNDEKKSKITKKSTQKTLTRARSVAFFLAADDPDLDTALAAAEKPNKETDQNKQSSQRPDRKLAYDERNFPYSITFQSAASFHVEPEPSQPVVDNNSDVEPESSQPVNVANNSDVALSYDPALEESNETPLPKEETYSLAKGGSFGLFSVTPVYPQQVQGEASKAVFGNANGPG